MGEAQHVDLAVALRPHLPVIEAMLIYVRRVYRGTYRSELSGDGPAPRPTERQASTSSLSSLPDRRSPPRSRVRPAAGDETGGFSAQIPGLGCGSGRTRHQEPACHPPEHGEHRWLAATWGTGDATRPTGECHRAEQDRSGQRHRYPRGHLVR